MAEKRKTYNRARRCPVTGVKLAGVSPEFLNYAKDQVSIDSVVEETGDLPLMNDVAGTVVGPKQWRETTGVTGKYLRQVLLPNSSFHAHTVRIGSRLVINISHVNSVTHGNRQRKRLATQLLSS